jgi:hypothetical protein
LLYLAAMRSARAAACLTAVALALTATACSDDGGLDPEAEEELLEDALLTEDDVPDGFEEAEPSDESGDDTLEDCLEEADIESDALDDSTIAEVDPAAFELASDEGFASVEAELRTVDPTEPAEQVLDAMGDDDFRDCVLEGFVAAAEDDDQVIDDASIDEADVPVDGDATGGLEFTGAIQGFDFTGQILVTLVGNHLVSLELTTVNEELDDDDVEAMFEAMIERLED